MNSDRLVLAAAASVLMTGCASYGNTEGAYDPAAFGEANRQSYAAMVVNPEVAYTEDLTGSAEEASDAVERYRNDTVKKPERPSTTAEPDGG